MLVIRRRPGERVRIAERIEIEILEIRQNCVKLGIRAPESVVIAREEAEMTRQSNIEAARTAASADIIMLAAKLSNS